MEKYKDKTLSPEERAKDLLSRMTLDEKFRQMHIYYRTDDAYEALKKDGFLEPRGGSFGNPRSPEVLNEYQDYCLNKTRLGIPSLVAFEAIHGLIDPKSTVFPQCAGLGGTFDRELINEMADVIGTEARAVGVRQVYAPDVDIPRDPRWGRMQETYGEDPYLTGEMGVSYIKGVQNHGVAATLKHFTAYGVPEGGLNLAPAHMGEREMREVTLEPFRKGIEAGALSVMPSYSEVDGVPVHASKKLLRDILRDELKFDGMTVSDYGALYMLYGFHHTAANALEAGKQALNAGVDLEAPDCFGYGDELKKAVENGDVSEELIDEAVYRILLLKFRTGLFEDPYSHEEDIKKMHSKKAVELSKKLDEEAILLLKNDGLLPLSKEKAGKIAIIGPNAKNLYLGDYVTETENCVSFYDGIKNAVGQENIIYAKGCNSISRDEKLLSEAIEKARQADTVFLVMGDSSDMGGGVGGLDITNDEITCGEGYDTHDLNFTPSQKELFDEIAKLKKPTLLFLYAGRPYTIEAETEKVNAFMFSWGGGEQSGNAAAELIFGKVSPSAKLSVSFPKTAGHIPCFYNCKVSARGSFYKKPGSPENPGRDYVLSSPEAWLPFGYGLSYTSLEYSDIQAESKDGKVKVYVKVKNKGGYDIKESVLLFVSARSCPITPFVKRLRSFKKVEIKKGEAKTVSFELTDEDFSYIDENYNQALCRGIHDITIADQTCSVEIK